MSPAPTTVELGKPQTDQDAQTYTLHVVGRYGHLMMLALAALSWAGEHLHLVGDQAQGTIQVTIGGIAVAKVGALVAQALAKRTA